MGNRHEEESPALKKRLLNAVLRRHLGGGKENGSMRGIYRIKIKKQVKGLYQGPV